MPLPYYPPVHKPPNSKTPSLYDSGFLAFVECKKPRIHTTPSLQIPLFVLAPFVYVATSGNWFRCSMEGEEVWKYRKGWESQHNMGVTSVKNRARFLAHIRVFFNWRLTIISFNFILISIPRRGYSGLIKARALELKLRARSESSVLCEYTCTQLFRASFFWPSCPAGMGRVLFYTREKVLTVHTVGPVYKPQAGP
jgi:hypothetical protein